MKSHSRFGHYIIIIIIIVVVVVVVVVVIIINISSSSTSELIDTCTTLFCAASNIRCSVNGTLVPRVHWN